DAGARLVHGRDNHLLHAGVDEDLAQERLDLAPAGAISDGDRDRAMLLQERQQYITSLSLRRRATRGIDGDVRQKAAGAIDSDALAAGAKARIDADHRTRTERRSEQNVAQVLGEHLDGAAV